MRKKYLFILLLASSLLRLYFVFYVPTTWDLSSQKIQAFNDEASHVNYVRYLLENKSLPVQEHHVQEENAFIRNEFEYYQPPLAYLITGILARIFSIPVHEDALILFCRIVICVIGLIGIALFYQFSTRAISAKSGFFLTTLYAFLPVHWRHTSSFSNDAFLWIFVILLLPMLWRKWHHSYKNRHRLIEGCIIGLGLITKASMITIVVSYFLLALIDRKHFKNWIIPAMLGMLIASPILIRNIVLYHELFGITASHGPTKEALSSLSLGIIFAFFRGLLMTFVIPFDTLHTSFFLRLPVYLLWVFFFSWFFVHFIKDILRAIKAHKLTFNGILSVIIIVSMASVLYYNWTHLQAEFRNIFYIIPVILLMVEDFPQWRQLKWFGLLGLSVIYPLILILFS